MLFAQLALRLPLLALIAFAPAFLFAVCPGIPWKSSAARWPSRFILTRFAAFGLDVFAPGAGKSGALTLSAGCAVLGVLAWTDARRQSTRRL